MAKKFTPPNLANRTDASLIDELGRIKQIASYAKFMDGFLKEALYARLGKKAQQLPQGETYTGTISEESDTRFTKELIEAYAKTLGAIKEQEMLAAIYRTQPKFVMRITPNTVDLVELDKDLKNLMKELGLDDTEY